VISLDDEHGRPLQPAVVGALLASLLWAMLILAAIGAGRGVERLRGAPDGLLAPLAMDSLLLEAQAAQVRLRNVCYGLAMRAGQNPVTECD
jgi:hypothetical protein